MYQKGRGATVSHAGKEDSKQEIRNGHEKSHNKEINSDKKKRKGKEGWWLPRK